VRLKHGNYECAQCGAELYVPTDAAPRIEMQQAAGENAFRVIVLDGREVHRCKVEPKRKV
jgi:hypothetical protein